MDAEPSLAASLAASVFSAYDLRCTLCNRYGYVWLTLLPSMDAEPSLAASLHVSSVRMIYVVPFVTDTFGCAPGARPCCLFACDAFAL